MILSDIVCIPLELPVNREKIEAVLTQKYGEIIRWAIIEVSDNKLKICLSYLKSNNH